MSATKENNKDLKYEPIVFVNKPAANYEQDVVGFKSQVETIRQAIKTGATMYNCGLRNREVNYIRYISLRGF